MNGGGVDPGAFDHITSRTYIDNGCNRFILANAWNATLNLSSTGIKRRKIRLTGTIIFQMLVDNGSTTTPCSN